VLFAVLSVSWPVEGTHVAGVRVVSWAKVRRPATGTAPSDNAIAAVRAVMPDFLMLLMCDSAGGSGTQIASAVRGTGMWEGYLELGVLDYTQ
jgi:hypothetical protein